MSRVYVVQGNAKLDFTKAEVHGEVVVLLEKDFPIYRPDQMKEAHISILQQGLALFGEDDFLLLSGDPINIGLCFSILANEMHHINVLKWDNRETDYIPGTVRLP